MHAYRPTSTCIRPWSSLSACPRRRHIIMDKTRRMLIVVAVGCCVTSVLLVSSSAAAAVSKTGKNIDVKTFLRYF